MPISAMPNGRSGQFSAIPSAHTPLSPSDMASRMARMEAFRKLKPTCVSLMAIASQTPTQNSQHAHLLDKLLSESSTIPSSSLNPAVINYILFPLTSILRQSNPATLPDNFLESAFRLLAQTTSAWRNCEGGMEVVAWEQLWKFCIAAVGPRMSEKGKGKEKSLDQEVQLQSVNLLTALLQPTPSDERGLPHPTPSMLGKVSTTKSPLLPTLFQTITFLLETSSPSPPHYQLQLSSLKLLRPLVQVYLKGKHEVLAAVLPGITSSMAKLVQAGGINLKSEIAEGILGLIEDIVISTLNDDDLRILGLLRPIVDDLSQLAEDWDLSDEPIPPDQPPPPSPASSTSSKMANPFPPLTTSYLTFTSTQLLNALSPIISTLSNHTSDLPRNAIISLCHSIIKHCHESLSDLQPRCLASLLSLSQDSFDPVRHHSRRKIRSLLGDERLALEPQILNLLSNALNSLPRLVTSEQEKKVDEVIKLITGIAQITSDLDQGSSRKNAIADLLGPNGGVEKWSWALLNCLEFGRPRGWSAAEESAERIGQLGWQQKVSSSGVPLLLTHNGVTSQQDGKFPHLPLRYIESETTAKAIGEMLCSLGSAGGETALHSVEYFILFAKANRGRQIAKSVSAVWVCEKLLEGISSAQLNGVEGKISKAVRKISKETVKTLVSMDEDEDDDDEDIDYKEDPNAEALVPVERTKGIDTLTTLLDRRPIPNTRASIETGRLHNQAQRSLLICLSLETLTLTSQILSSSFRPLLITSLYVLLSHLASPQPIIREYATTALHQIAYNIGYASAQNMVIDNVDYVINIVTLHLLPAKLSPTAPLVLIAMIRSVGSEIVPMVHDLVDEIFDALDDYHGYEALASSLLAVLGALIEVMNDEIDGEDVSDKRRTKLAELKRVEEPPNPKEDFEKFFGWWEERSKRRKEEIGEILERAPQHAWGMNDTPPDEDQPEDGAGETAQPDEDEETPPSRTQSVCIRILEKSIFYLTHNSPFLRYRILSIISNSVVILARGNREKELLPLIDKSWSSILNRLDSKLELPYVIMEGFETISKLSEEVGDFMSKRILDNVWPKIKIVLKDQWDKDNSSALSTSSSHKRGYSNNGREDGIPIGMDKYSISHRLHSSILKIIWYIVKDVPIDDMVIWEISVIIKPFLDIRVNEELHDLTIKIYNELMKRNGDSTWLILKSSLGELEGDNGVWSYLKDERFDVRLNVEKILLNM